MFESSVLLGLRIKRLREARGQTQSHLASKSGISLKHLGELERGRGNPSLKSIHNIASVLEISLHELFDFDQEGKTEALLKEEIIKRLNTTKPDVIRVLHRALKQ